MSWTIPIGILNTLAHVAQERNIDPDDIFLQAGVSPLLRDHPGHTLPVEGMLDAVEWLMDQTQEPSLSLLFARHIRLHKIGALGFIIRSCPDLGSALERIQRFHNIIVPDADITLRRSADVAILSVMRALPERPAKTFALEGMIAAFIGLCRELTRCSWPVSSVSLPHPITDPSPYEAFFGGRILYAPGPAILTLEPDILDYPIVTYDPHLLAFLEQRATLALQEHHERDDATISAKVRRFLESHLEAGAPTAAEVARHLSMSRRTLYRQLTEEGTSFGELLDGLRHELSIELLNYPSYQVAQIAFILGFSEPRAFHRAFKRWTGHTPSKWRSLKDTRS